MNTEVISTGIKGFDVVLKGGLIKGHSYLIVGSAGCGKTIFSLEWLVNGVKNGEKCVFISMAEPAEQIYSNVSSLEWDLSSIKIIDLSPKQYIPDEDYSVLYSQEVESSYAWPQIYEAIEKYNPDRLVIDSVTFMNYLSADSFQFRKKLLSFINYLKTKNCTNFLIYEPEEMAKDVSLPLSVDGVIVLSKTLSESKVMDIRTVEIKKLRGRDYYSGLHPFRITSMGIQVFPHIIEQMIIPQLDSNKIPSGIKQLDDLLEGGIEKGTVTLLTGPTGVGKSTLAMQFALSAAKQGLKTIYYSFEETPSFILKRAQEIGQNVLPYVESKTIEINHINSLELYPDELLENIRIHKDQGINVLILDSIRGYKVAMEQFGNMDAHIQNMVNFTKSHHITIFFINELEYITNTSVRLTELGISYIMDNAILMRFSEKDGKIIRLIGCIKKRLGSFQPEVREYMLTSKGILVGDKLPHCSLFTGNIKQSMNE